MTEHSTKWKTASETVKLYTTREEIANAVTHGIGTALSLVGLGFLIVLARSRGTLSDVVAFCVYGVSLVLLHLASTLYHSLRPPRVKAIFRVIDHSSIYLLIAGTYTPFLWVGLHGAWGITLLCVIWGLAIIGVVFKVIFRVRFRKLSVVGYLLMGWLVVIAARQLWLSIPLGGLVWVAVGGFFYTFGVVFYAWKRLPYNHAIWHMFVLGGSVSHYFAIVLYLPPKVG
ncbi:hemolysin III family protein [Candidatus Bipolaricaulota bacterium]|nr:hemolysin III family protein [Candidatus Bipolaricaulota bacterium]